MSMTRLYTDCFFLNASHLNKTQMVEVVGKLSEQNSVRFLLLVALIKLVANLFADVVIIIVVVVVVKNVVIIVMLL